MKRRVYRAVDRGSVHRKVLLISHSRRGPASVYLPPNEDGFAYVDTFDTYEAALAAARKMMPEPNEIASTTDQVEWWLYGLQAEYHVGW